MSTFSDDDHLNAFAYLIRHSWEHRRHAIDCLMAMNSHQLLLDTLIAMRYHRAYWDVVYHLGEVGFMDALAHFRRVLSQPTYDENYGRQKAAVYFLRRYPAEVVAPLLASILDVVVDSPLLDEIFHLLSQYDDDNTIYLLVRLMKHHPDSKVKIAAAGALGDSNNVQALSALLDVLNDEDASTILKEFAFDSIYRLVHKGVFVEHDLYFVGTIANTVTQRYWYYQATGCLRNVKTPESIAALNTINKISKERFKTHDVRFFR